MITVKEIARIAGVSPKTAERALSGVTKDLRRDARERAEKVREVARRMGYRPSEFALSLRRGSNRTIGFIVDILTDQFLSAAVETAMDEAAKSGYKVALQVVKFNPEQTREAIETFLAAGVDGIITSCCSSQLPEELMKSLIQRRFPFFTLCGRSDYECSSLSHSYGDALKQAVAFFAEQGHREIMLSLFAGKNYDNEQTAEAFRKVCSESNIVPDIQVRNDLKQASELAEIHPGALIMYGKYSIRAFIDKCREIGKAANVVGFYNEWTFSAARNFGLSGVILESAEKSVRMAVAQILNEKNGGTIAHLEIPARFFPQDKFQDMDVPDLASEYLFERM